MNQQSVTIAGKRVSLGRRIGRGGEGDVYLVEDSPGIAVKLYTVANLEDRPAKIRAMVAAGLGQAESLIAFPIAEVRSSTGAFAGFSMRLIDGCKPLHELYAPGARKVNFPQADYRFLVRVASNVARAVAAVHRSGCVIGDINHSGILVSPKAIVGLIDADSFQVETPTGKFLCKVGVPEYTPPELQGLGFSGVTRTPDHDAFGLAVVIFQLLFMGRHPFVGTVRTGDIPPIHENIAKKRYVYTDTRNVGMDQPPGTPDVDDFHAGVAEAFDKAFLSESGRPSAEQWVRLLDELEGSLTKCTENELHFLPKDASECPWCDMERQLGTFLFLPFVAPASFTTAKDPGAGSFDLDAIWSNIQKIKSATNVRLEPNIQLSSVSPSTRAKTAKSGASEWNGLAILAILGSLMGIGAAPQGALVWLLCFGWGVYNLREKKHTDPTPFTTAYIASEQLYQRELSNWSRRNGVQEFQDMYAALERAYNDYKAAGREEILAIARHSDQRQTAQLDAYLSTFPIDQATIRGIGPAIKATLASYGVDTAAAVEARRLQSVPGVGPKIAERLLTWRRKLEGQHIYRPGSNALDAQVALQARVKTELTQAPLRAQLVGGPQNLYAVAVRMRQIASAQDAILIRAAEQVAQTRADLSLLGIRLPQVPSSATPSGGGVHAQASAQAPSQSATPYPRPTTSRSSSTSAGVACPRCGSSMKKRLARKGRNAGSYFWGCSRYPTCRGTLNI